MTDQTVPVPLASAASTPARGRVAAKSFTRWLSVVVLLYPSVLSDDTARSVEALELTLAPV